jgi:cysteinyl-tRNA synthetase
VEVTESSIANAEGALQRLDNFADRVVGVGAGPDIVAAGGMAGTPAGDPTGGPAGEGAASDLLAEFRRRMDDDLDTPGAMAAVFSGVTEVNRLLDAGDSPAALALAGGVLEALAAVGLVVGRSASEVPPEVVALCDQRDAARADRDWAAADSIRDELTTLGWLVEDAPEGTRVRRP